MYVIDVTEALPAFDFKIGEDAYSVPLLTSISADEMRELSREISEAGKDGAATVYAAKLREIFDEHAPGAVSKLTQGQWIGLARAYEEASGISAGK